MYVALRCSHLLKIIEFTKITEGSCSYNHYA